MVTAIDSYHKMESNFFISHYIRLIFSFLRRHFLLCLSFCGLIFGVGFSFTYGNPPPPPPNQLTLPPRSPYEQNISGTGFIEPNTENVNLGAYATGIVEKVFVKAGDTVQKGLALFTLDQRTAQAEVIIRERIVDSMAADVSLTKVDLNEKQNELHRAKGMTIGRSISEKDLQKREFDLGRAQASLQQRQSQLEKAKADLRGAQVTLEKLTVTAPFDGTILKVRIRQGELVTEFSSTQQQAPILIGNISPLHIRVQIDENDIWRFNTKAKAMAYLKSNKDIHFPLMFVRIDPHAQPKQQLSGDSFEKVDTRVIEVIYKIEGQSQNLYTGQQCDVFIETTKGYS